MGISKIKGVRNDKQIMQLKYTGQFGKSSEINHTVTTQITYEYCSRLEIWRSNMLEMECMGSDKNNNDTETDALRDFDMNC